MGRLNCWEFTGCERQPGGTNISEFGICPATECIDLHGVHGGTNAGRACWVVAGSMSAGQTVCTFARKSGTCWQCDFFNAVRERESDTPFGFSVTRLGMHHAIKKITETDHLARITGIGQVQNVKALRQELKRTTVDILGTSPDVFLKQLDSLSTRKPAMISLIKNVSKQVYLTVDDRKASALEKALVQIVEKYC